MKINIEELSNTPDGQLKLGFHEILSELGNNKPVDGEITARLIPGGVKVEGHVETDMTMECDRCMENFPYHAEADIDEVFIQGTLSSAKELELTDENFVEELRGKKEIDVTDLVYQTIILSTPSKKLCEEECPGTEEFQRLQEEKTIDPRLEIFKKLADQELNDKSDGNNKKQ